MKKKLALLLAVLVVMGMFAGCGNKNQTEAKAPETQTSGDITDGAVIFDKDGVTVTTAGLDTDPTTMDEETIIWVDVQNTGAKDVYLGVAGGSVNGVVTEVLLAGFEQENGEYVGASYLSGQTIPAGGSGRYALAYYGTNVPGIDLSTLGEMEFRFTTSPDENTWYDYMSEPVVITVDKSVPAVDIADLGSTKWSNDLFDLVVGEQDYDDWFGPEVYVYMKNKSDKFVGISPDSAELDGVTCDYLLGGLAAAPGKVAAAFLSFDGEARELKGFENMTLNLSYYTGTSMEDIDLNAGTAIDPITVTYPPQVWGEYECDGRTLEIQPKYNDLITVQTDTADGMLFSVSETASMEADSYEGAGWLFGIGKVSEAKLHEMLCYDMSGADVFAKDVENNYYIYYHPTDVRYARATAEEMERDQAQWTMLCEWAESMKDKFISQNGLESKSFGNTAVDIYLARAAWMDGVNYTLSTTEFGPVEGNGVDGTIYAEYVMNGFFDMVDGGEAPDGEYVVLNLPDEDTRIDFFVAPGDYVRVTANGNETIYQAVWQREEISNAEAMRGWYYAAAEKAGVKPVDESLTPYLGTWVENIAGRATIYITKSAAPGKVQINASWPNSAAEMNTWQLLGALKDGQLAYENGHWELTEFNEQGEGWTTDESYEETGYFYLNGSGQLCWHDDRAEGGEDGVFDLAD